MNMGIPLGEQYTPGHPVVKRTAIGQSFNGAVVNIERRDRTRRGDDGVVKPVLKADGKPRQELVITCLTMPGTDAPAGIGDEQGIPETEDVVRLILKGKAFADWIQAERDLGRQLQVGDQVQTKTDSAQVYDANGDPKGDLLTTQEQVDAVPRSQTVGIYGKLRLIAGEGEWIDKAEAAYRAATATTLDSGSGGSVSVDTDTDGEEPW
jgi:hypothetical protein